MKIMVGYDGSNASKEALRVARDHARVFNAKVHVVHSMEEGKDNQQAEIKTKEKELEWCEDFMKKEGIACETHLLIRGLAPGEDLVAFTRERGVDEVVVGVKRRSRVGKMLMGSSAQYVILKAPCPVVCVK